MSNDEFVPTDWIVAILLTVALSLLGAVALEIYKFMVCGCPK